MFTIKLRRGWSGQDGWGAFVEEIAVTPNDGLVYRRSTGGNGDYGQWQGWEPETKAFEFLLGPATVNKTLRGSLVSTIKKLPDLEDDGLDNCSVINYGSY